MAEEPWNEFIAHIHDNPTKEEREKYFGDNLIRAYVDHFEKRMWGSPQFAQSSFHTTVGSHPNIRKTFINFGGNAFDSRFHTLLIQESATGKGRGYNYALKIMKETHRLPRKVDSTTDGRLLGSYDKDEDGERTLIRGVLDPQGGIDVIAMNEASLIIDARKTDYQKDFMMYYQIAMNTIGTEDNLLEKSNLAMGGEWVSFHPETSFYLETAPPEHLKKAFVAFGFLERCNLLYNEFTYADLKSNWENLAKQVSSQAPVMSDADIVKAITIIDERYRKVPQITIHDDAKEFIQLVMRNISDPLDEVNPLIRKNLQKFVPRTFRNIIVSAGHHAMTRLDVQIHKIDVEYAFHFINPSWKRVITCMEDSEELIRGDLVRLNNWQVTVQGVYRRVVKNNEKLRTEGIPKATFVKYLTNEKLGGWPVRKPTARSRLDRIIERGGIKEVQKGKRYFIMMIT